MTEGGRVAAVTGAASGIGRATALALSRQGVRVALCDRNAAGLAEVAKTIQGEGGQARVVELDVSDQGQAARAIDGVVEGWGRLDVLVNAAGILTSGRTTRGPVIGIAEEDWDRIIDVNVLGTVYCAQAAARHMIRQRSGRIVNIASIAGAIPRINAAAYGVSKAGVRMFTKCLALELARHGITVNAVAPGPIDTPMLGLGGRSADPRALHGRRARGLPPRRAAREARQAGGRRVRHRLPGLGGGAPHHRRDPQRRRHGAALLREDDEMAGSTTGRS